MVEVSSSMDVSESERDGSEFSDKYDPDKKEQLII